MRIFLLTYCPFGSDLLLLPFRFFSLCLSIIPFACLSLPRQRSLRSGPQAVRRLLGVYGERNLQPAPRLRLVPVHGLAPPGGDRRVQLRGGDRHPAQLDGSQLEPGPHRTQHSVPRRPPRALHHGHERVKKSKAIDNRTVETREANLPTPSRSESYGHLSSEWENLCDTSTCMHGKCLLSPHFAVHNRFTNRFRAPIGRKRIINWPQSNYGYRHGPSL